ncbi:MAG: hydantoinase/oxoprolinase family protein [Hyphomicrobiales bacterium]|nr:hydantoinase/oxoprolinase family protein [Hyphomicrobiales bacterium]MBV8826090.1 hydantoinase/oxoprolinase family protein [Hyphomicrobiales bacterium]MBV9426173.1 hydantoinase/oxoprolinase family protein [Bradyrhizobiaceae bacterium]
MSGGLSIGVDIGGTFTDVVVRGPGAPERILKIPSTRADPSRAVLAALERMKTEWGLAPADVARFVHGTTVATNAVLERKGARVGLITTRGFRDVLEIGRQMRHQMYELALDPETPTFLAPGRFRREIDERIGPNGAVLVPLDEAGFARAAEELIAAGAQAIAIVFLFSFLNDAHEHRARELITARHPDVFVSLSCEVDPAFREYERTVVTTFDAYVKPVVDRYLENLAAGLTAAAVPAPLQIMQSRGGISGTATARLRPVRLFLSGPAAGVIGAQIAGDAAGARDLITVDIGGTSCDIALIEGGVPALRSEGRIDGYPVRVGMVDVNSIGAGGGSIAWLDAARGLRVGPQSAGAEPGPACYGLGGTEPTVTDASVLLGYLDPEHFAGGRMKLAPELGRGAIARAIAGPLGMSVEEAALGIHRILNAQIAEGIRLVSIRQGHDPRRFTLLPLGGAGALHACALAEELGIARILVPTNPGVLSAAGLLAAPVEHEVSAALPRAIGEVTMAEVRDALDRLDARCGALMAQENVARADVTRRYFADVCYSGQAYYLEVPFAPDAVDPFAALADAFYAAHDRTYGFAPAAPVRLVNLRAVHRAAAAVLPPQAWAPNGHAALRRHARILLPEHKAPVGAAVYDRAALKPDDTLAGPAIIEQDDTTTLVTPGWRGRVDRVGNLVLERNND